MHFWKLLSCWCYSPDYMCFGVLLHHPIHTASVCLPKLLCSRLHISDPLPGRLLLLQSINQNHMPPKQLLPCWQYKPNTLLGRVKRGSNRLLQCIQLHSMLGRDLLLHTGVNNMHQLHQGLKLLIIQCHCLHHLLPHSTLCLPNVHPELHSHLKYNVCRM